MAHSQTSPEPTPQVEAPGGWPETPALSSRQQSGSLLNFSRTTSTQSTSSDSTMQQASSSTLRHDDTTRSDFDGRPVIDRVFGGGVGNGLLGGATVERHDSEDTVVQSATDENRFRNETTEPVAAAPLADASDDTESEEVEKDEGLKDREADEGFAPIKTGNTEKRPNLSKKRSQMTEDDIFRALSRRKTNASTRTEDDDEEQQEIERLMSRMFGKSRQEQSEEEKTRHVGVIFKHLTVKGVGLGATLQPSNSDFFLGLPRFLKSLFARGPKKAAGKPPVKTILDDFTGCVRPGEMLLVLGRPGAGCSTFLKILGNQRFGYKSIDGDVTYGGTDAKTMHKKFRSEVLYNPEDDLHYATLKVKATLEFALKTRTPGKDSRKDGESRKEYVAEFLRVVSKLFWIEHTLGTKVGNELIRGVSGGEKKRVSIAEAMITKASVQAWDNSTRGLDSSTALEYCQSIRSLTNMAQISSIVALYQAGENLYNLFDKVVLIHEGHCCYYGPTDRAAEYFKSLGFIRPDRWTSADFITSVTNSHESQVKDGWEDRVPRTGAQFGEAFRKSEFYQHNIDEVDEFDKETKRLSEEREAAMTKATKKKNFTIPFHKQVVACTHRQFLVMFGDQQSLFGKWLGLLFQALIVGSLFFNLQPNAAGVFTRGGVIFFVLLFNALLALAELTAAFESRPILLKHRSFSFYRPAAYAIAQTVVDVPLVFIQVVIFNLVVYFMANLQRTPSQFFISILFLWILTMTMYAFFRAVGALVSSLDVATRITGVAIQALIVYTGYLIPPTKMRPWFGWLRWINPVQYGFESLMANEFYNLDIECIPPYLVPQLPDAQTQYQGCAIQGSRPGQTIVRGADYIQVAFQYSRSHLWRNFGFICAFFIFFVCLTALGMEMQKPNKGGGAVTIYKRGQVPENVEKAMQQKAPVGDEESGTSESNADAVKKEQSDSSDSEKEAPKGVANETVFTWQNVNYTIPYEKGERTLLQDVQGYVKPGKLTALMGASGAGKTTLLNTLAQRINFGVINGDFLVDGKPLPKSFQRSSGFAEQMDVHEPTSTVREALRFSAKLRQPKETPLEEKYDYCEKIIDLLELRHLAGATVGKPGAGLNQEQRKRLTIGVELASKPELLLFLDEPTSGLDSGAAFNVVRFLRKLADAGQAILCTIHQPSAVLFEHFDQLLLLKSGGRTVYFGPLGQDSREMISYFESNGGKKCPQAANPAEYMLEVIGAGDPNYKGKDWGDVWASSKQNSALTSEIQDIVRERQSSTQSKTQTDDREYAMPLSTQISTVLHRCNTSMWRSTDYTIGIFSLHIITGLFNAFTFFNLGSSQIDMQSRLFSVFMTLTICPPLIQQLQPRFLELRSLYTAREGNAKIYSWIAFVIGAIVSEIPYRVVAGTLYWACWYWAPGFPYDTFTSASMWLQVIVFEFYYLGFGQAIAAFCPNELFASLLVPIFFTFIVSFCGVVVPAVALPTFWRSWMYWLTPFKYLLSSMLSLLLHSQPLNCERSELALFPAPPGQTCESYASPYTAQAGGYVTTLPDGLCGICQHADGDQFASSFSVQFSNLWRDFGIVWIYVAFNFLMVGVGTWIYCGGGRKVLSLFKNIGKGKKMGGKKEKKGEGEKV